MTDMSQPVLIVVSCSNVVEGEEIIFWTTIFNRKK